ncbi:MAG: AroM family protein [Ktedonobacteraceae bacterium]|nr:AroM family protein [Ktedonobacteraceae bacterium]
MKTVGLITIGQAPRPDLVAHLNLPDTIVTRSAGALDDVNPQELRHLFWHEHQEALPLVTRYGDHSVLLANHALAPYLQRAVSRLQNDVDAVTILCTESFPQIESPVPYVRVDRLIEQSLNQGAEGRYIAALVPTPGQIVPAEARWSLRGYARAYDLPPNADEDHIRQACAQLRDKLPHIDCLVLDCMAYSRKEVAIAAETLHCAIIWPAELLGRHLASLEQGGAS